MIGLGLDGMTTTHGGIVHATTNLGNDEGRAFLRVGDWFWCPLCKCKSELLNNVYPQIVMDGRAVVPIRAKFSCGAELIGVNNHTVMEDGSPIWSVVSKTYSLQYQLLDEETGEPLKNYPYTKIIDGEEISGVTDANGYTQKINKQSIFRTELKADSKGDA